MNGLVDLTGQDLLSTGNGKSSHFVTKRFTSTLHFLSSFSTSILDDAVGFDLSLSFGFIDDTLSTLFTVRNNGGGTAAGSVFIGNYSPESAGDYASGTNHTLPTGGWARACSGVNVDSFMRKITFQELTRDGLDALAPAITAMAEAEGLDAHANAVRIRTEGGAR